LRLRTSRDFPSARESSRTVFFFFFFEASSSSSTGGWHPLAKGRPTRDTRHFLQDATTAAAAARRHNKNKSDVDDLAGRSATTANVTRLRRSFSTGFGRDADHRTTKRRASVRKSVSFGLRDSARDDQCDAVTTSAREAR
jgi:hypothetical protein